MSFLLRCGASRNFRMSIRRARTPSFRTPASGKTSLGSPRTLVEPELLSPTRHSIQNGKQRPESQSRTLVERQAIVSEVAIGLKPYSLSFDFAAAIVEACF